MLKNQAIRPELNQLDRVANVYQWAVIAIFILSPAMLAAYLLEFQQPPLLHKNFITHEGFVALSILLSGFVSLVSYQCYRRSGEPLLFFMTLAFLSFTLVYSPHGFLTRTAAFHPPLFLLFGPFSRLVMAIFFFLAMNHFAAPPHDQIRRASHAPWIKWGTLIVACLVLEPLVAFKAGAWLHPIRIGLEIAAISLFLLALRPILIGFRRSSLFVFTLVAIALFVESGVTFIFVKPWEHVWWLSHGMFAAGFAILSYGIMQVYQTTSSFSQVFIDEEALEEIARVRALSMRKFSELADRLPVLIWEWKRTPDQTLEITYMNSLAQGVFGDYANATDIGHLLQKTIASEDVSDVIAAMECECGCLDESVEFRLRGVEESQRWLHMTISPGTSWDGGAVWRALAIDITALKQEQELRRAADHKVAQMTRYKALSQITGGITHEINNLIQPVLLSVEVVLEEDGLSAEVRNELENVLSAAVRLRDLVDGALRFQRFGQSGPGLVDADQAVEQVLTASQKVLPLGVQSEINLGALNASLAVSNLEISQIVINLLKNASQAIPSGQGNIKVSTALTDLGQGETYQLIVEDNGHGMDGETLDRALEPFFTNKEVGQGTGLGLSIIKEIVDFHQGTIEINSKPGVGTKVQVNLPTQKRDVIWQNAS